MDSERNVFLFRILVTYAVTFCLLSGCAASITRGDLLEQMQEGSAPLVVDVRSNGEYDRDHIPGAIHIPFYTIGSGLAAIGSRKKEQVVLYCEHGPRASFAAFTLFLKGYEKVYTLEGSMKAWRKNDFPIEVIVPGRSPAVETP